MSDKSSGFPDYLSEVWRGAVSLRLQIKENESLSGLMMLLTDEASVFNYAVAPLASGGTQKAIDIVTGLEDTTIPAGYTWSVLSYWWAFNRPFKGMEYRDAQPFSSLREKGFVSHYEHDVLPTYYPYDPTGASAHTFGYTLTNLADDDIEGFFNTLFLIREVGTDRLNFKLVKCKYCGAEREVNRRATKVRCEECGQITFHAPRLWGPKERPLTKVIE